MKHRAILLIFCLVVLTSLLAGCSAEPTPEPTIIPSDTPSWEITTATPVTPTATMTGTPTETPTETPTLAPPTEVPTSTPTFDPNVTPTPTVGAKPQVTARSDTNCRKSPDANAKVLGYFLRGHYFEVLGRDEYDVWVLIPNPTNDWDPNCWVWTGNTNLSGDLKNVPIIKDK